MFQICVSSVIASTAKIANILQKKLYVNTRMSVVCNSLQLLFFCLAFNIICCCCCCDIAV